MYLAEQDASGGPNHPRAIPMAVIAFLNYNLPIACMWGSFSVLLVHVEARLGIGRNLSTLAPPAISLTTALCAPLVGQLATRYPLRLIMLVGSLLTLAGYVTLALTASYPLYLAAYGLLLGPGMAAGVITPGTLVTRWFAVNRGKAMGLVTTPAAICVMPLLLTFVLRHHALPAAYLTLAALSCLSVIASLFVQDRPPAPVAVQATDARDKHRPADTGGATMAQLAKSTRFWALFIAFIASSVSSVVIGSHFVPMAISWHMTSLSGAKLLSVFYFSAIPAGVIFGWIADRVGAVPALVILAAITASGWILLLAHPPFVALVVLMALIGGAGAGVVPVFSLTLSEAFGRESFSRGFGLANLAALPFSVLCVPVASLVFTHTGSYSGVIMGMTLFIGLAGVAALTAWRRPPRVLTAAG